MGPQQRLSECPADLVMVFEEGRRIVVETENVPNEGKAVGVQSVRGDAHQ